MRRRLLRGVLAAGLAAAVATTGTAQPARADIPGDVTLPPAGPTVTLFFNIWRIVRGGPTASEIESLIQQAISAVNDAENQIISHLDALEAARATADARAYGREFLNYPVIRQSFAIYTLASNASRAAALDYEDLRKVGREAGDEIGHALEVVYPIALAAAEDAGWTEAAKANLRNEYRLANELMVQKLEPTCSISDTPLAPPSPWAVERRYDCVAADGGRASATELYLGGVRQGPAVNVDQLKVDAAIHSSWLVAVRILPTLRTP
ncbi:MAG: hypothetical protein IRZ05_17020 [Micromonosporaceae bacterium]|jgi:hypothetical protein|nr:hypothetical protein [Micromonosporaceae bacterium]